MTQMKPQAAATTSHPTTSPVEDIDLSAEVAKLKGWKEEAAALQARLQEVQGNIKRTFSLINQEFDGPQKVERTVAGRKSVEKPRPATHKMTIAAGRVIVQGVNARWTPEKTKQAAIAAALANGDKYGVDKLPAAVMATIDKKIKMRFNLH